MTYIIGVDGGGTKTHAVLVDEVGTVIAESYTGPANIRSDLETAYSSITGAIDELLSKHHLNSNKVKIGIGVAGYSVVLNRENLITRLNDKYKQVRVESDCHIACLAAHGKQDGAIVICGTGVVGYYIQKGRGYQLGGWGFPHGDLGGGAWFGLEICRLLCKAIDGVVPWSASLHNVFTTYFEDDSSIYKAWLLEAKPNNYTSVTKLVLSDNHSDNYVQDILTKGVAEIEGFIAAFLTREPNLAIKLVGGLSNMYLKHVTLKFPLISLCETSPAYGATLL